MMLLRGRGEDEVDVRCWEVESKRVEVASKIVKIENSK